MTKKSELHEVLAVEGDLEHTFKKILDEARNTFEHKREHFLESTRTVTMNDDSRSFENTSETSPMVETVSGKLDYIRKPITRYFDCFASKERTNQDARADLVVDGETLITGAPATLLLGLEKRLASLRDVYLRIPTLDPAIEWVDDAQAGGGVSVNKESEVRFKTEKTIEHKIVVPADEHHPAQVERWTADKPIGRIEVNRRSSMMTPYQKSLHLERIDKLIRAVKRARQKANKAEVVNMNIGNVIFDFIHG